MRVLVVDDDPVFLERARVSLLSRGAIVCTHLGARGALFAAREFTPDLVLLDVSMPGLSGTWLLSALRNQCTRARILFCSDTPPGSLRKLARIVGADGAVSKSEFDKLELKKERT